MLTLHLLELVLQSLVLQLPRLQLLSKLLLYLLDPLPVPVRLLLMLAYLRIPLAQQSLQLNQLQLHHLLLLKTVVLLRLKSLFAVLVQLVLQFLFVVFGFLLVDDDL